MLVSPKNSADFRIATARVCVLNVHVIPHFIFVGFVGKTHQLALFRAKISQSTCASRESHHSYLMCARVRGFKEKQKTPLYEMGMK